MNIAVILTCHNRKEKTVKCLQHLFKAVAHFNSINLNKTDFVSLKVFLTDDGCTDGTAVAVKDICGNYEAYIIQGNGNCYWAGGMLLAWREALQTKESWDYYLLLNDDTYMLLDCFSQLVDSREYCMKNFGKEGVYSGITHDVYDEKLTTYGGSVWTNYFLGHQRLLNPIGRPQQCDMANSNIMFVHSSVVEKIGIFWDGFEHGAADYDYSMTAVSRGIPVLVTSAYCGVCEYDHYDHKKEKEKLRGMSLSQRKKYYNNPLHSYRDKLRVVRRHTPFRYPIAWFGCWIKIYLPKFYCFLSDIKDAGYSNTPKQS